MLKDWLLGKIETRALNAGVKEMGRFVAGLRAMDDRDIGAIVAIATAIRINLETHGVIAQDVESRPMRGDS